MQRRPYNMSDNQGQWECECRRRGVWGSHPGPDCQHCDGTGYTNDIARKKDWNNDPPREEDY